MNLKQSRILISNDDGVGSDGIALLERIARTLSDDVWVVAPAHEQSGAGHSLSLHAPLRYTQVSERRWAVAGTPTDAVLVGVMEILKDKKPDLMLSGINRGSNLAEDVTYSGTVSAAMEATLLEIPSIALSNTLAEGSANWQTPEAYAAGIIRGLTSIPWSAGTLMNVNFPAVAASDVKGIRTCPHGRRKLDDNLHRRVDPHGRPYIWIGGQRTDPFDNEPDSDYKLIKQGFITITPLNLDMTEYKMLEAVRGAISAQEQAA
jgi:5'-nucleotidase